MRGLFHLKQTRTGIGERMSTFLQSRWSFAITIWNRRWIRAHRWL